MAPGNKNPTNKRQQPVYNDKTSNEKVLKRSGIDNEIEKADIFYSALVKGNIILSR